MHMAEAGSGEPVLLLHGFPQHWWEWRKVLPGLAERHRIIAADLRGAGWTDAPRKGYTRDQMVIDVVELMNALELDRVHLLTHDVGALLGYQLCLGHPDRVRRHLSLSIPPPYFEFDSRLVLALLRDASFNLVTPVPLVGPLLMRSGRQRLLRHMLVSYASEGAFTEQDLELFVSRLREPARARAGSALYRRFIQPEAARILSGRYRDGRLRTPTLVLVGADDPTVRPQFLHGYEDYVDDLEVRVVEGASHFLADDAPDAVVAHALDFFDRR
jgi:pimeloyl-ACP methyl ester carboxylesterase